MQVDIDFDDAALTARLGGNIKQAQQYLDNEILKDSTPFVPMDTGMLLQSGITGTVMGSGEINYTAPYAAKQYYLPGEKSKDIHPQASPQWFEKAKAVARDKWIKIVKKIGGGGEQ